jgi:hypothetical protein
VESRVSVSFRITEDPPTTGGFAADSAQPAKIAPPVTTLSRVT